MIKAFCRKGVFFSFILTGCLILFNVSCGLDTVYYLEAPNNTVHKPDCDSIDQTDSYFEFWTVDKNYDGLRFLGTEVYYKIYTDSSRLKSEAANLQSLSNSETSTSASAERMINTYGFKALQAEGYSDRSILIPASGSNQRIYIRLSDYGTEWPAKITVNGNNIYGSSSLVIPVRNISTRPSFNFQAIKLTQPDKLPQSGDADLNTSGTATAADSWYISMFAVAVGQDSTYSHMYSNILYLGSVKISSD